MEHNNLADYILTPMATHHFEIAAREIGEDKYAQEVVQAARAVLVEGATPAAALADFQISEVALRSVLSELSTTWCEFCAINNLVTESCWLPQRLAYVIQAVEACILDQVEQQSRKKKPPKWKSNE